MGCEESVVGLVIPTGYSFNLDGTCIYLTMAALFLAQATNTDLSLAQELGILAILLLTSKGAAGVTGSGFIVLAATLSRVGTIPVASIALILGIDRFMSEARALTNLVGNGVATVVVAKWENALDMPRLQRHLARHQRRRSRRAREGFGLTAYWDHPGRNIGGTAFGPAKYSQCTVPGGQWRDAASAARIMPAGPQ